MAPSPHTIPFEIEPEPTPGSERTYLLGALFAAEVLGVFAAYWGSLILEGRRVSFLGPVVCAGAGLAAYTILHASRRPSQSAPQAVKPFWVFAQIGAYLGCLLVLVNFLLTDAEAEASPVAALVLGALAILFAMRCYAPPAEWSSRLRTFGLPAGLWVGAGLLGWVAAKHMGQLWNDGVFVDWTFQGVVAVLQAIFSNVRSEPEERLVGANGFDVIIHPTCSGYEGLGMIAAFLGLYLALGRHWLRFPQAFLLLPLGLAASWVLNILRIAACVGIGACGYPDVAVGGFHSEAGWLAFNAIAIGLVAMSLSLPWFRSRRGVFESSHSADTLTAYLSPLIAILAVSMLTHAISDGGFDRYYPLRTIAALTVVIAFRDTYSRLGWMWSGLGVPLAVGMAVWVMWLAYGEWLGSPRISQPPELLALPAWKQGVWLILRVVGACVTVPLAEELAFRGVLLRGLLRMDIADADIRPRFRWWAAALTAVAFGWLHPGWELPGFVAGLAYAWVYARRNRLADAVVAHAATNAALVVWILAWNRWDLW